MHGFHYEWGGNLLQRIISLYRLMIGSLEGGTSLANAAMLSITFLFLITITFG